MLTRLRPIEAYRRAYAKLPSKTPSHISSTSARFDPGSTAYADRRKQRLASRGVCQAGYRGDLESSRLRGGGEKDHEPERMELLQLVSERLRNQNEILPIPRGSDDEITMVRMDVFEAIVLILRLARKSQRLPPVSLTSDDLAGVLTGL